MGGENNGFYFFSLLNVKSYYFFNLYCFFCRKKIKIKGMLFQILYDDILVRQKLKMKHGNPLINSVCIYIYIYLNSDPLLDE